MPRPKRPIRWTGWLGDRSRDVEQPKPEVLGEVITVDPDNERLVTIKLNDAGIVHVGEILARQEREEREAKRQKARYARLGAKARREMEALAAANPPIQMGQVWAHRGTGVTGQVSGIAMGLPVTRIPTFTLTPVRVHPSWRDIAGIPFGEHQEWIDTGYYIEDRIPGPRYYEPVTLTNAELWTDWTLDD